MAMCTGYVTIKQVGKPSVEIPIDDKMTVMDIKGEILMELDVPTPQQRLLLKGKVLPDDKLLVELGIEDGTVVNLIAKKPVVKKEANNANKSEFDFAAALSSVDAPAARAPQRALPQRNFFLPSCRPPHLLPPSVRPRIDFALAADRNAVSAEQVAAIVEQLAAVASQTKLSVAALEAFAAGDGKADISGPLQQSAAAMGESAGKLCAAVGM